MPLQKQTITIRFATEQDCEKIAAFRVQQYKTAKEFHVVDWNAVTKQQGKIFIAEADDSIISTMQIETVSNTEQFEKLVHFVPADFNDYQTIYLSKAATAKGYRNTGLNSFLRKLTLNIALKDHNIHSLSGIAYEFAPRLNLLEKLGYGIQEIPPELSYIKPLGKALFLRLKRDVFKTAYDMLAKDSEDLQNEYVIIDHTSSVYPASAIVVTHD